MHCKNAMSPKIDYPVTPAVRFLREKGIQFVPHLYPYEEHGGTRHAAESLQVPEHAVIKTLVFSSDKHPLLVLMHGDREVSTRQLARVLGVKHVTPCEIADAQRYTGYTVGGISPFGTRTAMSIYVEETIFSLPRIYINGGKRGFLVEIDPADLKRALNPTEVEVAIEPQG
jgi:Cys-tRNA(Pro) deacylase